jgi:hypothetical protein
MAAGAIAVDGVPRWPIPLIGSVLAGGVMANCRPRHQVMAAASLLEASRPRN